MRGGSTSLVACLALAACGGREVGSTAPADSHPRLQLVGCTAATPPPVLADDGVSFGGLTKAEILELKRAARPSSTRDVGKLELGTPVTVGGIDRTVLARVIRAELGNLRGCYERELARNPTLVARLDTAFTIEADGRVSGASAGSGAPAGLAQCVTRILGGLRFPALAGGGTVRVRYPFLFDHGGAPGVPPPAPSPEVDAPAASPVPGSPWTPYALEDSPPLDVAPLVARATEPAIRARLDRLAACFPAPAPTGSLRAMLEIAPGGELRGVRVGGLGDATSEACIRRELAGLRVKSPTLDGAEVACDLSRGDAQRWRVSLDGYEVITATRTHVEHRGQTLAPDASEPEALPANRTYVIVVERDTPGTVLELALAWAFEGDATLIAMRTGTAPPVLLGIGRSTFALGDAHDDINAVDVSLQVDHDRLAACVQSSAEDAPLADPGAVRALLASVAARCRKSRCASTVGVAVDGGTSAGALPEVLDAIRRAGFERALIGGGIGCRAAKDRP